MVALGFSRALLSKYVKEGLLERGRQGVYILPDSVHDDMYTLMLRSEKIVFSHDTALFLNGLSERTPFEHSVTIPSNSVLSDTLMEECTGSIDSIEWLGDITIFTEYRYQTSLLMYAATLIAPIWQNRE